MTKVATDYYKPFFAHWGTKLAGEKPTHDMLHKAHGLGCRPGKQALHIAMCLRADGCTVAQFINAGKCGPANNKRRELAEQRLIKVVPVKGADGNYAYCATVTDKGLKAIEAFEAKAAETPAEKPKAKKAKGAKAKGNKRKGATAPAEPVTVEAEGSVETERNEAGGEQVTA